MIIACAQCGQDNRIPAGRLTDTARCGACKSKIGPVAVPFDVNTEEFSEIVKNVRVPVLVDFWAAWCGPCRMAAPIVKQVASDMAGRALVLKVDTDRHPELAGQFQVRGIPHFVLLKNQEIVRAQAGLLDRRALHGWLEQAGA